jgi:energy-coupling factor transport system ATP-binding protein
MECYKIENLTFKYPTADENALSDISLSIHSGEFITICGKSGSGKSTLIRQLKPIIAPHGEKCGDIYFMGQEISELNLREQSEKIGFVSQNPDNQIVTDKVWHELAFGLESLGTDTPQIRARVAEMASFFGIQTWFHKNVNELSGGQKQLLNLASVMVLQPTVIILDEPTSQLDPIAAQDFLEALSKINRELGTTIILTEHRLEEAFTISDRVIVMDNGVIVADDKPCRVGKQLKEINHDMFAAMPAAMRIYAEVDGENEYPVTVREGRQWFENFKRRKDVKSELIPIKTENHDSNIAIELKDVFFRYEKNLPDVVRNLSLKIYSGEFYAIVGGNGTGKTTTLSVMSGINIPHRGKILINGTPITESQNLYSIGMLPQNPQSLFVKKTVILDLYEMLSDKKTSKAEKKLLVDEVIRICELEKLLDRHPYDLSGGEQQRAALAKLLLLKPQILLLDEPTKGLDAHFKIQLAQILKNLQSAGITIVMVSHDIEFCAEYADRCAMFFDGNIVSEGNPQTFFSGKSFYTTAANRMARQIIPNAVLVDDVVLACGGTIKNKSNDNKTNHLPIKKDSNVEKSKAPKPKILSGILFAVLFVISVIFSHNRFGEWGSVISQIVSLFLLAISINCFIPQRTLDTETSVVQTPREKRKITRQTLIAAAMIFIAVPLTVYFGIYFLGDRKYYFISLLIIFETLIPFFAMFEKRKPQVSEIVIISVLCAIAVAGRAAFYMLPQFKPVVALVIISGVCMGGETGFLVGAITAFVSNFFFGQGPWTPWQMFTLGMIGFLAGVLFQKGFLRKTRGSLCIFGFIATIVIYGGIMNPASVLMWQSKPTAAMIVSSYLAGLPFDLIHASATVFFLWIAAAPMIEKLDRIKFKYGIGK